MNVRYRKDDIVWSHLHVESNEAELTEPETRLPEATGWEKWGPIGQRV